MLASIWHLDALLVGGIAGALAVTVLKPVVMALVRRLRRVAEK